MIGGLQGQEHALADEASMLIADGLETLPATSIG